MAVTLTGTSGLMTRLSKIGNIINVINAFRGSTVVADVDELQDEYNTARSLSQNVESSFKGFQSSQNGFLSSLRTVANDTVVTMIHTDNPQPDNTIATALKELIRQFEASSNSIEASSIATSVTAGGSNAGDGQLVIGLKDNYGKNLPFVYDENLRLTCISDAQNITSNSGNETFVVEGEQRASDKLNFDFPAGSGGRITLGAIPATSDNSRGNLLNNSDYESFTTANTPDNWVIVAGAAGAEVLSESSAVYQGSKCLKLVGTGTDPILSQTFGTNTGGTLRPLTTYSVCFWARVSSAATGTLTVRLYDATNSAVLQDEQGNDNELVIDIGDLTTTYTAHSAVFRTPRVLPASVRIEVVGTSIESAKSVFVDHLSMGVMSQLYAGGPFLNLHSGASDFIRDDSFVVDVDNDYASQWATLLEQLFDLNDKGLVFPTDGSPTIADSMIS